MEDLLLRDGLVVGTSNKKISHRHLEDSVKTKKRAARAAQLFFLIQPIKSLIRGVIAVISSTRYLAG